MQKISKRMRKRTVHTYLPILLDMYKVYLIAEHVHKNISTIHDEFDSEMNHFSTISGNEDRYQQQFNYKTGAMKKVKVLVLDENGEETGKYDTVEQEIVSILRVFKEPSDNRYKTKTDFIGIDGVLSNLIVNPSDIDKHRVVAFNNGKPNSKNYGTPDFKEYCSEENLNTVAWLFGGASPTMSICSAFMKSIQCKGIDIYMDDTDMFMKKFGLEQDEEVLKRDLTDIVLNLMK